MPGSACWGCDVFQRPRFLDRFFAPWTWVTLGVILYPRHLVPGDFPAILAHERVHQMEQLLAGALLLPLGLLWWPLALLAPLLGVATWLALWRFVRPFRAAAEVRGIRAELAAAPAGHRARLVECYAAELAGERYFWAFSTPEDARRALGLPGCS